MGRWARCVGTIAMVAAFVLSPVGPAQAAPAWPTFGYGLTVTNRLVLFNLATPGTVLRNVAVTGLQPGETLRAIDVRPADGQLYGLAGDARLYLIDPVTGVATAVGPQTLALVTDIGMDFNPVVDRIRGVDIVDRNFRLNPNNGALVAFDSNLAYAPGDPNVGANPNVVGSAYTVNIPGWFTTALLGIDSGLDVVVSQNPNAGLLTTKGPLGVDTDDRVGFDIVNVNDAFATLTAPAGLTSALHTVNIETGSATLIGTVGGGEVIRGFAIAIGALACTVPVGTPGVIFAAPGGTPTFGTAGNDVICGTSGVDRLAGLGGHDLILGLGGIDQITGGEGDDYLYGGPGNDQLAGDAGFDYLFGDAGNDDLTGGLGVDRLFGNADADRLVGGEGPGDDECRPGNAGPDPGDLAVGGTSCELIA